MCSERRATFQKTDMEENGKVHPCFSINLTKWQMVVSILVGVSVLIGSVFAAGEYAKREVRDISDQTFRAAIQDFHEIARPQIEEDVAEMIAHAIVQHQVSVEKPFEARLDEINERLARTEAMLEILVKREVPLGS